jgi:citrate synthase
MSRLPETQSTSIATSTADDIFVRGKSLCRDLVGQVTFTQMTYFHVTGRMPTPAQTAVVDACLVALMEHGLTPSVLAARLVCSSAPEALQGAVAAGLMGVGSVFVGTVEGCAALLERIVLAGAGADEMDAEARRVADEHRAARRPVPGFGHPLHKPDDPRSPVPGFGHPLHKPDDPRSPVLLEVAGSRGVAGKHVAALRALSAAVDAAQGRHLTINATGAIAGALLDAGVPAEIMRGFAILARCAGLVGHVHEEQRRPAMRAIWAAAEEAVPYDGEKG